MAMRVSATVSAHSLLVDASPTEGQRVLMVRLAYKDHRWRKWSFPGGFVDAGESVEAALLRETLEEVGVQIEQWQQVAVVPMLDQTHPNVSFIFLCPAWQGEAACCSHELLEVAWVDRAGFQQMVQEGCLAYPAMRQQVACLGWDLIEAGGCHAKGG